VHKKVTAFTCSLGLSLALLMSSGSLHAAEKKSPYWQCVTFARAYTGMQIFGDAWTWWDKAAGKYATGHQPQPGAVLAFPSQGRMSRGHVAVVSRVVTERIITITHANWSPIGGRRGQVEEDVTVVDVSDKGDWSEVKVWYDPLKDIGSSTYRTYGFIYNTKDATPAPGFARDRQLMASNETLDGVLSNNAALNDSRPASMKTSVMVRFPARPQTASVDIGADADVKKPVSIEAVLANRDEATASAKKASLTTSARAKLKTETDLAAEAKSGRPEKALMETSSSAKVTSAALAEKLTGEPVKAAVVKASATKKATAKKPAAQKTRAVVKPGKAKVTKAGLSKKSVSTPAAKRLKAKA
jgi:surface antigen